MARMASFTGDVMPYWSGFHRLLQLYIALVMYMMKLEPKCCPSTVWRLAYGGCIWLHIQMKTHIYCFSIGDGFFRLFCRKGKGNKSIEERRRCCWCFLWSGKLLKRQGLGPFFGRETDGIDGVEVIDIRAPWVSYEDVCFSSWMTHVSKINSFSNNKTKYQVKFCRKNIFLQTFNINLSCRFPGYPFPIIPPIPTVCMCCKKVMFSNAAMDLKKAVNTFTFEVPAAWYSSWFCCGKYIDMVFG